MINTLEYDAMRSPGKTKLNAGALADLLKLQDYYTAKLNAPANALLNEAGEQVKRPVGRPRKL